MERIPVAVLGATGVVGQRLVALLDRHPWMRLAHACASDRSVGKPYREATRWQLDGDPPESAASLIVESVDPVPGVAVALSALDASVAGEVEQAWARAGAFVSSNARSNRLEQDVPLLVPEINASHLELLGTQRLRRG